MDTEERLHHLLYMMMDFDIARYLMSCTEGRYNGAEKAQRHINLSYIYVASRISTKRCGGRLTPDYAGGICTLDDKEFVYSIIHDATQSLTDNMDEVIGFPIDDTRPNHEVLVPKFFEEFIRLADIAWFQLAEKGLVK